MGRNRKGGWFDWIKQELKGKAEVYAFDMPNTDNPEIEAWVGFLQEKIKDVDKESYFVGHSIGCQTILRFLERLPKGKKVGGCAFVGGWFELILSPEEEIKIAEPWLETPINFAKVKSHCNNFLAIFSDDDPYVPLSNVKLFEEKLGVKTIVRKKQEHFIEVKSIPEVLDFLTK